MKSNKSKKKLWNYIFGSFKLFPSSKIDFWPFLKLQKMEFGQKIFREIDLFEFTSVDLMNFIGLDFLKFSDPPIFFGTFFLL